VAPPSCSAVTAVGKVVTYLRGLPALARFFRRASAALPRGGFLAFDFVESAAKRTGPTKSVAGEGWTPPPRDRLRGRARGLPHAHVELVRSVSCVATRRRRHRDGL